MDFKTEDYKEEQNFILNNPSMPTLKLMREFAEYYHKNKSDKPIVERSLFNKIRDKVDELYRQMENEIPFTQSYNNLNERKGKLLQTLRILEREELL